MKQRIKASATVMMVLLICVPRTGAQVGLKKVAQSTMNFLQVNVSARAAGLGESFIAVGEGAESLFFNPAGIAEVSGKFDVQMYNTRWITDIDFLAGQQRNMEKHPEKRMLNNTADAGVVQARRVIDEYLSAEAGTSVSAE